MLRRIKSSPLYLKLFVWEYWPSWLAIIPTLFCWLWFAIRAKHPFFFSAVNPAIETGGWMGESKARIMHHLPLGHLPKTVHVSRGTPWEKVQIDLQQKELFYPLIAKPDIGKRGFQVLKIEQEETLRAYHAQHDMDFMIQEYIDVSLELGIFYHRFPGEEQGAITSVCLKEFLQITGDGHSTTRELMSQDSRANLQLPRFERERPEVLDQVPAPNEKLLLEPIGNHCRGTRFLNGNYLIDDQLSTVFDQLTRSMDGIHFGRFDIKCKSLEGLRQGNDIKILEFNGISAEPTHIYDSSIPVWKKYRDIYRHWEIMYHIYLVQRSKGVRAMGLREAHRAWSRYWRYLKEVKQRDWEGIKRDWEGLGLMR